ncbi:MAG: toprim domain-containing protein [Lacunisphaera sp.]
MIPIRDHQGRVVAFTARQLELTPQDDASHEAKYVNSPETPIFTKSNLLFNLDRARSHAGEGHAFVLVEGQLDALRCWSVGLKTAIAPQGTSITEGQLALLRRYHAQVECFFDSDSAGQKAALRFLPMALKAGLEVRFLTLAGAEKLDPDLLFLEKGLAAYDDLKRDALAAMPFAKRAFLPDPAHASFNERMNAVRSMVEIALQAETQVARDDYLQQVSLLLGVQPDAIRSEVAILERRKFNKTGPEAPTAVRPDTHTKGYEEHLLYVCLHHEAFLSELASHLAHEWIDPTTTAGRLLDRLLAEVQHNGWNGRESLEQLLETEEEKSLAATMLFQAPGEEDWAKIVNEGLRHLQKRFLEPKKQQIELEIASKGAIGDPTLPSLLKQRAEITRQLLNPPRLTLVS